MKGTILAASVLLVVVGLTRVETQTRAVASATASAGQAQGTLDRYCATCHSPRMKAGGLAFDALPVANAAREPQTWEKVIRKVRTGMMPPAGAPRPDRATLDNLAAAVETTLDRAAATVTQSRHARTPSTQSNRVWERRARSARSADRCGSAAPGR